MSVLSKPYELSVWEDVLLNGQFVETKLFVIGSNTISSQSRALQPKLVTNVNGSNTFTFSIYYQYKDNATGEKVENPFAPYLTNERKLKLYYDDTWYDFIIKSVKVDSTKYTYEVTATDQYINELSKNGFNLTFDAELTNNVGSVQTLAHNALSADTNWKIPDVGVLGSEFIPDIAKESLVKLHTTSTLTATLIRDTNIGVNPTLVDDQTIPSGAVIYGFYSCCKDRATRFSFYYFSDESIITIDDERVIKNREHQYFIDNVEYDNTSAAGYGIGIPNHTTIDSTEAISYHYRGARYVFSPDVHYSNVLKNYVSIYSKNNHNYYGFTKTEYKAPNLINDWVSNGSQFQSTSGWTVARVDGGTIGELTNDAVRFANNQEYTLVDDLRNNTYSAGYTYTSILTYTAQTGGLLVNSGFYDNRTAIDNLVNGQQFIVRLKTIDNTFSGHLYLGTYPYDPSTKVYTLEGTGAKTFFDINLANMQSDGHGYKYAIATIANSDFTPKAYKKQTTNKVNLIFSGFNTEEIVDFQIFEYIQNGNTFITPDAQLTQAQILTTYYLYNDDVDDDETKTINDFTPVYEKYEDPLTNGYTQVLSCEKRRSITVKESNYFNIIQTICENFECWASFKVGHNADGTIDPEQKYIIFKNYIGDDNFAGFRYGVNLKSVSRTDDSKQFITKLIVKQNSNEFGEDGFCTIARAGSNETGENYILNVDYYINHGLLSSEAWIKSVYDTRGAQGKDINPAHTTTNSNGYYVRLRDLNDQINERTTDLTLRAVVLARAKADLSIYENGLSAAIDEFDKSNDDLHTLTGKWIFDDLSDVDILKDSKKYLVRCSESLQAKKDYEAKAIAQRAYVEALETLYTSYEEQLDTLIGYKTALNKAFYSTYYRYIQEGTWNSEDYYDDEKYYLDALSTIFDASIPKVSYNMSVLELSQLQGYEDFKFALGDKTYIEDPEFFGYDENGNPIREDVTLTEITYNLDSPEKNSIKISTYKNSFQDLFKKITATVQSVSYSQGAYDNAAQLAVASDSVKSAYLQGALNDAGTILQNLAQQSVRIDTDGLTITDSLEPNKALRAVAGGILLTQDGGETWELGVTAKGINAKIITTGILNTGSVNIMYGDEPTFRWDAYGLTAYGWNHGSPLTPDLYRGVRFDRMGIYGFTLSQGTDSADWHPTDIAEWKIENQAVVLKSDDSTHTYVRTHSMFELTEQGLYLNLGRGRTKYHYYYDSNNHAGIINNPLGYVVHEGAVYLGKIEDVLYNTWSATGVPYYVPGSAAQEFVKIFSVGPSANNEKFVLYDDGTIKADKVYVGSIQYNNGSGLVKTVYSQVRINAPAAGTSTTSFPDTSTTGWHNVQSGNDQYLSISYNNGATWTTTDIISGKTEISRTTNYGVDTVSTKSASSSMDTVAWTTDIGSITLSSYQGKYLYTRYQINWDNGTSTSWIIDSITPIATNGAKGDPGDKTAIVYLYKRSASDVSITWSNALEYSFVSHSITSTLPTGWSQSIPADDGNPCYVTAATAYSSTNTDSIAANEWAAPTKMVKDGQDGLDGHDGQDGGQTATVFLYRRMASGTPSVDWTNTLTYNFTNHALTSTPTNWSLTVPTGADKCYVTTAAVYSRTNEGTIAYTSWSTPVQYSGVDGTPGAPGSNGYSSAVLTVYQRSATEPSRDWSSAITYTFSTNSWNLPSGSHWSKSLPTGTDPCYIMMATASSNTDTDSIAAAEWTNPVLMVENGEDGLDGQDGANGISSATLSLYKRSADTPTLDCGTITYNFESGSWTLPSGCTWSKTVPTGTDPCYIVTVTALSAETTTQIPLSRWSSPVKLVENGRDGTSPLVISITNEFDAWPCNSDGTPSATLTSNFNIAVYEGTSDVTNSWSLRAHAYNAADHSTSISCLAKSAAPSSWGNEVTFTNTTSTNAKVYIGNITQSTPDKVEVIVTATKGTTTLQTTYTLVKNKKGADGEDGLDGADGADGSFTHLWTSSSSIKRTPDSTSPTVYSPTSITFRTHKENENGITYLPFKYAVAYDSGTLPTPTRATSTAPDGTQYAEQTITLDTSKKPNSLKIAVYTNESTPVLIDMETISIVRDGNKGDTGSAGANTATIYLYRRSSTTVTIDWRDTLTYTFNTHTLNSVPSNWYTTIPSGTDPCYVTAATAYGTGSTDEIAYTEWAAPVILAKDGATGATGAQTATVFLYKRSSSGAPAKWTETLTYTFSTKSLSSIPSGWSMTVPDGTDLCYVSAATAYSTGDTASLPASVWSTPVQYSGSNGQNGRDGTDGQDGAPGANGYATVVLTAYVRLATPPQQVDWTSAIRYTFATNAWSIPSGSTWSKTIPAVNSANPLPCYASVATASSNTTYDDIEYTEWSAPIKLVENGEDGLDGADGADGLATATLALYKRAASQPSSGPSYSGNITYIFATPDSWSAPSGWSKTIPDGTDPCYISRAVALSNTGQDDIPASEWTTPELFVKNGVDGRDGQDGAKGDKGDKGDTGTHGVDVQVKDIYIACTNTTTLPTLPATEVTTTATTAGIWTLNSAPAASNSNKYVWHCKQTKTTSYETSPATVTLSCDTPELWKAYNGTVASEQYATYLKLTNFSETQGLMYDKTNGNLYINATYINTGTLTVSKNNNTVFSASLGNGDIYMQSANYSAPTTGAHYAQAGTKIDVTNGTITSKKFAIESDGSAWFDGTIHTTEITGSTTAGGLTINFTNGTITATHFNIDALGNATYDGAITASQISGSTGTDGLVINFDDNTISSHGFNIDSQGNASYTGTVSAGQLTTGDFTVKRGTGANLKTLVKFEMSTSGDEAYLQSSDYDGPDSGEVYADEGMRIDLEAGTIIAENFVIDSSGNAYFKGELQAASGTFEGTVTAGAVQSSNYADPTGGSKYSTGTKIELQNGYITTPWFYTDASGAGFKGNLTATQTEFNKLHVNGTGNYTATNGIIEVIDDKFIIRSYSGDSENFYSQLKLGYLDAVLGVYNNSNLLLHGISFTYEATTLTGSTTADSFTAATLIGNISVLKNATILMSNLWYGTGNPSGTPGTGVGTIYFKIID